MTNAVILQHISAVVRIVLVPFLSSLYLMVIFSVETVVLLTSRVAIYIPGFSLLIDKVPLRLCSDFWSRSRW
jgi:hypothetical protein